MFRENPVDVPSTLEIPGGPLFAKKWHGSALHREYTLHQVSPYIGKMKSSMASALLEAFSKEGSVVYDPFCGAGTVALEARASGRNVFATDLNPYAVVLTKAKLFPPRTMEELFLQVEDAEKSVGAILPGIDIENSPDWVRDFFHPRTFREVTAWAAVLRERKRDFLLACLLGILHHQRPGFLSYPSSHTVPYLRDKKFPKALYPGLYEYREVKERLDKKVIRTLKRVPPLNVELRRECLLEDALEFTPPVKVDAIITSPPYMRQLDYGRDNRLRLWFLGKEEWKTLNGTISPTESRFLELMKGCFIRWHSMLTARGTCVLVLGNGRCRSRGVTIPEAVEQIAVNEMKGFSLLWRYTEAIPDTRRVRKHCSGSTTETVLALRKR